MTSPEFLVRPKYVYFGWQGDTPSQPLLTGSSPRGWSSRDRNMRDRNRQLKRAQALGRVPASLCVRTCTRRCSCQAHGRMVTSAGLPRLQHFCPGNLQASSAGTDPATLAPSKSRHHVVTGDDRSSCTHAIDSKGIRPRCPSHSDGAYTARSAGVVSVVLMLPPLHRACQSPILF